ncbi:MAG: Type II secretion system protein F [Syntrophus sp. SKADARSKE-3]|nr:Type II secretion system protein F [Syntrophus sp. SKADARSKE-3]
MLSLFAYKALDASGQENKGTISAANSSEAVLALRSRGLVVIDLNERREMTKKGIRFARRFGQQDLYSVARELSTLLRSGMRIDKSLEILISATSKQDLKQVLEGILTDIKAGRDVAEAFGRTGRFSSFLVSMIHVGEAVGALQPAFENIAQYLRFQIQFKSEIRGALTYPVFLIFASILTFVVIFNFIVPRFFSIFGTNLTSLPLPAKILYTLSGWLSFRNIAICLAVAALVVFANKMNPTKFKLPNWSSYLIRIPMMGNLILNLELSRFSYSMYSILSSGVTFIQALSLSASLIQNEHLRHPITSLVGQIKEGKKISDVFMQVNILPDIYPNMIMVGEESGNLKDIFFELYQIFDERFKNSIKMVLTLVEPIIILLMGLLVGFIVITLILTVMSVSSIKL